MAKDQWVDVEKRKLKLSNLEKVLYPDDGITKAEVVEYYLNIAPTMLYHIKGRPLTLIRYPDGLDGEQFFQKNIPDWAPDWIDSVSLGGETTKNYTLAEEKAALIWLANLASLELHQMHSRSPHYERPDYMVFDLDPPEDADFRRVIETALNLKNHIQKYGYHPFVKTTGGKGVHLLMPLEAKNSMTEVFEAAKEVAQTYVSEYRSETTLQIKKKARKGRILIDIYRNRTHQTIVSPYSLRGKPGAPVSMPLKWEELSEIKSSDRYHLKNAVEKINSGGDAWEGIGKYATALHTHRNDSSAGVDLPESDHHKSPDQLEEYRSKRDFGKTAEPDLDSGEGPGNRFVIQRHHATRLHYDLRLEQEGALRSWAVPKGLPPRPGIKRLAVETEDHPLEYLTFEGKIPKGEYGGGQMWVYALGRYEITKQKEDSMYFRLESEGMSGEYRMYRTDENKWLLEKLDEPQIDWLNDRIDPMHAHRVTDTPKGDYVYEVKWDGIRALIGLEDNQIRIRTRNQNEVTEKFPELQSPGDLRATCGLFDAEIVSLDDEGKPDFQKVINRLKTSSSRTIERLSKSEPVYAYVFDCLYLDGRPLVGEPLYRRYEWLQDVIKKGGRYRISEAVENGEGLFKAAQKHGLEGIMAKKKESVYQNGKRSDLWLKVKVQKTADCLVIGYTKGKGDRSKFFGALHLAESQEGELVYRGKVGTGFDGSSLKEVYEILKDLKEVEKPIDHEVLNEKDTIWVEPKLVVEVNYASLSNDNLFREAVYQRLRPDLSESETMNLIAGEETKSEKNN